MKIIISPYSRKLRNGNNNPKNYPYWQKLIKLLKEDGHTIIQVGSGDEIVFEGVDEVKFDLSLNDLTTLFQECDTWMGVDNFFQHFASHLEKPGIVIFGKSNPDIFGYKHNINILKDRANLRAKQFDIWEEEVFNKNVFPYAEEVFQTFKSR